MQWVLRRIITETIINNGDYYVLDLKDNHKNLHNDTVLFFDQQEKMQKEGFTFDEHETIDADHGRIETRKHTITSASGWLQGKENWVGLKCIGMVESIREIDDKCSYEKRYYISSLDCNAEKFGNAVRRHWGIENSVHWVLDIAFREDESRIRKGAAPENFGAIRHIALNLLRNNKSFKGSIKSKRLNAAMDIKYLEEVMFS